MGCLSSNEVGLDQYRSSQTQVVTEQNQNVTIQLPDPKLFEFDQNFLKGCEKIEKRPIDGGEIEGQIVNNEFNGKGRIHFDNGDIYEGELKNGSAMEKGFLYIQMVVIMANGFKIKEKDME